MTESVAYPRFRWLVLIAAVFSYFSMQIANLSIATLLPQIAKSLNVDMGAATNLMTVFLLSGSIALFFAGIVSDRFGVLVSTFIGLICAAVPATLMPLIGNSYTAVVWARIFQGFSVGFFLTAMGPIIAIWFPPNEKGLAGGLMGASVSVGSAIGLMGGSVVFKATGSWQMASAIPSIIAWIGLIYTLVLLFMPKPKPPAHPDMAGQPQTDGAIFKKALFSFMTLIGVLVAFCANWCLQCLYNLTPTFLAADKPIGIGFGEMMSAKLMLAVTAAGIIGPIIGGIMTDKTFRGNVKPTIMIGFAMCFVFIYGIQSSFVYSSTPFLLVALILAGMAVQFVFPSMYIYIAKVYSVQVVGKMSGLWSGIGAFGGVVGLLLGGIMVNRFGSYNPAVILVALSGLAGFIFTALLPKPKA